MASGQCLGGFLGTILFGLIIDKCGRKATILMIALPQMVANVLIAYGTHPYYVYAARMLFGLSSGGLFTAIPTFVTEISHER